MIIQQSPTYKLEVRVQWLDRDQVHLKMIAHNLEKSSWVTSTHNYFMEPEELAQFADYIQDTLAR